MKRIMILVLAFVMLLSLCACGKDQGEDTKPSETQPTVTQPAVTQPSATQPTDPQEPSQPTVPTDPSEPSVPSAPTEPSAPAECSHSYRETGTKDPTCAKEGVLTFTCIYCDDSYVEYVAKLEHTFVEATCEAPMTCSVCGATEGEALGHDFAYGTCSHCGAADTSYKQLEEGVWYYYEVGDDGLLYYIQFTFADGMLHYVNDCAEPLMAYSAEDQAYFLEYEPARVIEYKGKKYLTARGVFSMEAPYVVEDRYVAAQTEEYGEEMYITFERQGKESLLIVESYGFCSVGKILSFEKKEHKHMFLYRSCTEPMICVGCEETRGEPQGHNYVDGACTRCGEADQSAEQLNGRWTVYEFDTMFIRVVEILFEGDQVGYSYSFAMNIKSYCETPEDKEALLRDHPDWIIEMKGEQFVYDKPANPNLSGSYTVEGNRITLNIRNDVTIMEHQDDNNLVVLETSDINLEGLTFSPKAA